MDPYTDDQILKALHHIRSLDGTQLEVDIINMSFGGYNKLSPELHIKLTEVASTKTVIAAAGTFYCFHLQSILC